MILIFIFNQLSEWVDQLLNQFMIFYELYLKTEMILKIIVLLYWLQVGFENRSKKKTYHKPYFFVTSCGCPYSQAIKVDKKG